MKKKVLALFIVLMLVLNFTGCFPSSEKEKDSPVPKLETRVTEKIEKDEKSRDTKEIKSEETSEVKTETRQAEPEKAEENKEENVEKEIRAYKESEDKAVKEARLVITSGFGKEVILDRKVLFAPESNVMDVLKANAEVKNAYGGGFVSGINGIESRKAFPPRDWFYYVNGICAACGAGEKKVLPGDFIWWDYHPWKAGMANTAVIGAYPEPFLNGYNGKQKTVKIIFSDSCREGAGEIKASLESNGVKGVVLEEIGQNPVYPRSVPTVVVAEWDELKKISYFQGLNQAYSRNGMGFYFAEEGLYLLNYEGKKVKLCREGTAVIGATGDGLGDENPLWLITGTDSESVLKAVDLLKKPEKIRYMYGAALLNGEVIRLPLE